MYLWGFPLKGKKGITVTNAFQKNLDKPRRKPRKIWPDKVMNFTIDSDIDIKIDSKHNEEKSVIPKRFNRTYKLITNILLNP